MLFNFPDSVHSFIYISPRYFFNFASRRCEEFLYGGCRGNQNNFKTLKSCISSCGKHPRIAPPPTFPEVPQCKFGNDTYNIGDIVRFDADPCRSCLCSAPPALSCSIKTCPAPVDPAPGLRCQVVRDDIGCCVETITCVPDSAPYAPPVDDAK